MIETLKKLLSTKSKQPKLLYHIVSTIGLLLPLLNAQLNIGHQAALAKTAASLQQTQQANALCPKQLSNAIESITKRREFSHARWGILVQTLKTEQTLYSHDANKYFIPASNVKLLTTAAALTNLGADYRIRTSVYGTNDGLRVVGRGDPSLTDVQLRTLAKQLYNRGIRQVKQIITEDNYFRGATVNPTWEWEDLQADYGAPVNSLIVNQNATTLTLLPQKLGQPLRVVWAEPLGMRSLVENKSVTTPSGEPTAINVTRNLSNQKLIITGNLNLNSQPELVSLAVINPSETFLLHLYRSLIAEKIKPTSSNITPSESLRLRLRLSVAPEIAFVESPPLSQLILETNQDSNNLYAEALLQTLGAINTTKPVLKSTDEAGLYVVKETLTQLGVDPTGYVLADGSGLSRHNLVTPEAIAQTLRAMVQSPQAAVYRASLPVAGINGSLKNRFQNTTAQGIVQAKTGTMSGIVALSGYLDAPNYQPLVFSIIANQSSLPASTIRAAIDEIVLVLTYLRSCR